MMWRILHRLFGWHYVCFDGGLCDDNGVKKVIFLADGNKAVKVYDQYQILLLGGKTNRGGNYTALTYIPERTI